MTEELSPDPSHADQLQKVCHDLKQNIATGLLLSEPVASESLEGAAGRRLEVMHQQWEQVAALVALLSGDLAVDVQRVDLVDVAAGCVAATRAGREVDLVVEGDDHVVPGDRVLLRRAMGNLLDNADRATPPGGRVTVRVGSDEAERWVEVVDEGPGFGHIASGTGLGLQVVRAAVWECAGRLRIETGPRCGTVVRMSFPAALRLVP